MSSKKKRMQEKSKTERVNTGTTEAVKAQETIQVPEIQEIQERKEDSGVQNPAGNDSGKKQQKNMVARVLFGSFVTVAIVLLAVCLYKTSKELQTVQTMSGSLLTDLQTAETKLDELLKREEAFLAQAEKEAKEETTEEEDLTPEIVEKPRTTPEPERYTVCIDAGHGAHDSGAVLESEDGTVRCEKDDNLWLAQLVKKELEAYGIKVLMTRDDDSFLELYDRTLLANSMDVEALISFHRNAYYVNGKMNDRVGGVEIWIHNSRPTEARQLANRMLDAILEVGGMADRGVRYGSMTDVEENYAINRRAMMTSMIVEMGFISNPKDNEAYDRNGEAYAKAIAKEIYDWLVQ